jgi:hypothetical protein
MDELLSQLRGTQHGEEDTDADDREEVNGGMVAEALQSSPDLPSSTSATLRDPASSQTQTPFQALRLNFDLLKKTRERANGAVDSAAVRKDRGYRIEGTFVAVVKKTERYSEEVTRLELVDESGAVQGSILLRTANEAGLRVGSIIVLSGCALWKVGENHLNIVHENIREVV